VRIISDKPPYTPKSKQKLEQAAAAQENGTLATGATAETAAAAQPGKAPKPH